MKTKLLYAVAAVILVALLAVAGCSNPLSGGSGTNVRQATVAVTDSGSLAALASGRVEIVLLAGQDQVAGTVNVTNDSENLYVEFLPSEQWCIIETHVHVANSLDGFPLVGRWQTPAPGQFDFKTEHNCEPSYEYTIALGDLDVHEDFIIAAHAKLSDGEVTETAWAAGTRFSDQGNWATYFTYSWTFMLNLDVAPEGTGSVAGQGRYPAGAQVPLSATPEDNWQFVNWTEGDQVIDTDPVHSYLMPARDHTLTANFKEAEPEAVDLTGYWNMYMVVNGEEPMGPEIMYILQKDAVLTLSYGGAGIIDGLDITVEFWMEDEEGDDPDAGFFMAGDGTVSPSGDEITIWFADSPFGPFAFHLVRTTMKFGPLVLEGTFGDLSLSLDTEYAVGQRRDPDPDEDHTSFVVTHVDHELVVHLWVMFREDVVLEDIVGEQVEINGEAWIDLSWRNHDVGLDLELYLEGPGWVELTRYDDDGFAGSFSATFVEEEITGSFDVYFEVDPFF